MMRMPSQLGEPITQLEEPKAIPVKENYYI